MQWCCLRSVLSVLAIFWHPIQYWPVDVAVVVAAVWTQLLWLLCGHSCCGCCVDTVSWLLCGQSVDIDINFVTAGHDRFSLNLVFSSEIWELCTCVYDAKPTMARIHSQTSPCIIYDEQVALEKIFLRAVVWGGGFKPNQNTYSCCTGSARPSAPNVFKFSNHRGKSPR